MRDLLKDKECEKCHSRAWRFSVFGFTCARCHEMQLALNQCYRDAFSAANDWFKRELLQDSNIRARIMPTR